MFAALGRTFPDNLHSMVETAKLHARLQDLTSCVAAFEQCRAVDPLSLDGMDVFAETLLGAHDTHALNRLSHDLLKIEPKARPEPWVACALSAHVQHAAAVAEAGGNDDDEAAAAAAAANSEHLERALGYADKAAALSPTSLSALRTRATILGTMQKHEEAKACYVKALAVSRDLSIYRGLVQSFLALSKPKEAMIMAREAVQLTPRSADAVALVGTVYATHATIDSSRDAELQAKAKKAFTKALSLDRLAIDPLLQLAKLHENSGARDEAIKLLKDGLAQNNNEHLHTALASVYANSASEAHYQDALKHYHSALSINASLTAASEGLERLEKLMRGVDPDADEELTEGDDPDNDNSFEAGGDSYMS
eukprot:g2246.t1